MGQLASLSTVPRLGAARALLEPWATAASARAMRLGLEIRGLLRGGPTRYRAINSRTQIGPTRTICGYRCSKIGSCFDQPLDNVSMLCV